MIGRLNHVAIAVPDLAGAAAQYRDVLGARVSDPVDQPDHGVTAVFVELPMAQAAALLLFAPAGALVFALTGVLAGLWSDRWDNYSAAESFLILPLGLLSGAFFPLDGLPEAARTVILRNPAFHAVDGLRFAVTGYSAWSPWASLAILLLVDLLLAIIALRLFTIGYKIKP